MTRIEDGKIEETHPYPVPVANGGSFVPENVGTHYVGRGLEEGITSSPDSYRLGPLVAEAPGQTGTDEGKLSEAAWGVIDMYLRSVGLDRSQVSVLFKAYNELETGMFFFQARHGLKVEKGIAATADLAAIKAVDRLINGYPKVVQQLVDPPSLVTSQALSPDSLQGANHLLTLSPFRGPVCAIATDQFQGMYYVHVFATLADGTVVTQKAAGTIPSRIDAIEKAIAKLIQQNGGVQTPRVVKKFDVLMSLSRFEDLGRYLPADANFLHQTGGKAPYNGKAYEVVSVVFEPERYEKEQDYRAQWDLFKTKVLFYYDHAPGADGPNDQGGLLQKNNLTVSALPQNLQDFLRFVADPPQVSTDIK